MHWIMVIPGVLAGVPLGWWLCSLMWSAKSADMMAMLDELVAEKRKWERKRRREQ